MLWSVSPFCTTYNLPAYVSTRQHTSAYVSTCFGECLPSAAQPANEDLSGRRRVEVLELDIQRPQTQPVTLENGSDFAHVVACIRQHTSAYVSIRQHASADFAHVVAWLRDVFAALDEHENTARGASWRDPRPACLRQYKAERLLIRAEFNAWQAGSNVVSDAGIRFRV
jgi:hypothetical protein